MEQVYHNIPPSILKNMTEVERKKAEKLAAQVAAPVKKAAPATVKKQADEGKKIIKAAAKTAKTPEDKKIAKERERFYNIINAIEKGLKSAFDIENFPELRSSFEAVFAAASRDMRILRVALTYEFSKEQNTKLINELVIQKRMPFSEYIQFMKADALNEVLNDHDIASRLVAHDAKLFEHLGENIRKDTAFVASVLRNYPAALKYSPLRNDKTFMLGQINSLGVGIIQYCDDLRSQRGFMLEAMKIDYKALQYASPDLKRNESFMLEAIKQDARAIAFAANALYKNKESAEKMLAANPDALKHAAYKFLASIEFILQMVAKTGSADCLSKFDARVYKRNKGIAMQILKIDPSAARLFDARLLEDPQIVQILAAGQAAEKFGEKFMPLQNAKEAEINLIKKAKNQLGNLKNTTKKTAPHKDPVEQAVDALIHDIGTYKDLDPEIKKDARIKLVIEYYYAVDACLKGNKVDTEFIDYFVQKRGPEGEKYAKELFEKFGDIKAESAKIKGGQEAHQKMQNATSHADMIIGKLGTNTLHEYKQYLTDTPAEPLFADMVNVPAAHDPSQKKPHPLLRK